MSRWPSRILPFILLVACGGGEPEPTTPATVPAAPAPTAPAAVDVGPEGPTDIAIPTLADIPTDAESIKAGETVWGARGCGACHAFGKKLVGPDLVGVTTRRPLPWIERMITDPEKMTKVDPTARELFKTHMVQMTKQGVPPEDLPKLLAYVHSKGG